MGGKFSLDRLVFNPPQVNYSINNFNNNNSTLIYLYTERGSKICMCLIFPENKIANKYIIFSHGNASDINSLYTYGLYLAEKTGVFVVLYDYPGYGFSDSYVNRPTEEECYASLKSVIEYIKKCNHGEENILLIGQSLGTGVVIDYLAKNIFWQNPVVLISAYKSISRVIYDSTWTGLIYNKFDNIEKIRNINCPIKFFHGLNDNFISPHHTTDLYNLSKDKTFFPTYIPHISHNDILYAINIDEIKFILNKF